MSDKNTQQELLSFISEARRFLEHINQPEWASSGEKTDEEHFADVVDMLKHSRRVHGLPEKTEMHWVRSAETKLTFAFTGNTPLAAERARFLTGLLTSLPRLLEVIEASLVREVLMEARIQELLESNNEKLFENRAQRQTIRQLQAQVDLLLKSIPAPADQVEEATIVPES